MNILKAGLRSTRLCQVGSGFARAVPKQWLFGTRPLSQSTRVFSKITNQDIMDYMAKKRREKTSKANWTIFNYMASLGIFFLTLAYASVPLYRVLCSRIGFSGTPITDQTKFLPEKMVPLDKDRKIRIKFTSATSGILPWKFTPQQREVVVVPGETALSFYKAKNKSDKDIIGMATYSVTPGEAAQYFNKIQCFCFEEQKLLAGEEVDMPLFFFIDPDFLKDPQMRHIDDIVLHYTFFKAQYSDDEQLKVVDTTSDQS